MQRHPCPDCERAFASGHALVVHRNAMHKADLAAVADADGRFHCPHCARSFAQAIGLRDHGRTKHKEMMRPLDYETEAAIKRGEDDEPSLAEIAIEASIKRDSGETLTDLEKALLP